MSLVAYDSSDDNEDEGIQKLSVTKNASVFVKKKVRESVKINIPSLKEFKEENIQVPKKPKLQSGSGLFGLLPPPKNASKLSNPSFVPYVLTSKKENASLSSSPLAPKQSGTIDTENKISNLPVSSQISDEQESDDDVDDIEKKPGANSTVTSDKDFFSLDDLNTNNILTNNYIHPDSLSVNCSVSSENIIQNRPSISQSFSSLQQSSFQTELRDSHFQYQQPQSCSDISIASYSDTYYQQENSFESMEHSSDCDKSAWEPNVKEVLLKDKRFLKLQGKHQEFENVDIIDVNADDQLTHKNEWIMKSLTEESTHRPLRKKNMPTQQQKRKHQITYLAFQAKEREMDLKNQWALNSRTRRETQAKYGF